MRRSLLVPALLLALPAGAQPWRYEKDGAVHYTSDVNQLPPKLRARILAARAAEDAAKAEAAEVEAAAPQAPPVRPDVRPGRIKGQPAREAGSPMPADVGERPPAPIEETAPTPPQETRAEKKARLAKELAAARLALADARRQALLIPDGHTYAVRTAAERRVAELEAELAALR